MRMLRLTLLSLAVTGGAASADGRIPMPGAATPKMATAASKAPATPVPPAAPTPSLPQSRGAAPRVAANLPAPTGAQKAAPERRWSIMKNRPLSPPAAPQALTHGKGIPRSLPPGGGVPGKGVPALRLTPLDHGIEASAGAFAPRGAKVAPAPSAADQSGATGQELQLEVQQAVGTHSRSQKARSDLEKKDEATKKAIADNIRG